MSRWGSHNKYSKTAITNNFVAWLHGYIVATELSRAQLYFWLMCGPPDSNVMWFSNLANRIYVNLNAEALYFFRICDLLWTDYIEKYTQNKKFSLEIYEK